MPSQKQVDVQDGRLVVSEHKHIDLIGHVYRRGSDRELLKELALRVSEVERADA